MNIGVFFATLLAVAPAEPAMQVVDTASPSPVFEQTMQVAAPQLAALPPESEPSAAPPPAETKPPATPRRTTTKSVKPAAKAATTSTGHKPAQTPRKSPAAAKRPAGAKTPVATTCPAGHVKSPSTGRCVPRIATPKQPT
jgi:hypothetical protein